MMSTLDDALCAETPSEPSSDLKTGRGLNKFVDSALLAAATTATFLAWGLTYYSSFYDRLGVMTSVSIRSPFDFIYFSVGFIFLLATAVTSIVVVPLREKPGDVRSALLANLPLFILGGLLLFYDVYTGNYSGISTLFHVVFILLISYHSWQRKGIIHQLVTSSRHWEIRFLWTTLILGTLVISAHDNGRHAAEQLVRGESNQYPVVELTMKNSSNGLTGRQYGLAAINEGRYFLVEISIHAPDDPVVHIIPESEILSLATVPENAEVQASGPATPQATPAT